MVKCIRKCIQLLKAEKIEKEKERVKEKEKEKENKGSTANS